MLGTFVLGVSDQELKSLLRRLRAKGMRASSM